MQNCTCKEEKFQAWFYVFSRCLNTPLLGFTIKFKFASSEAVNMYW